MACQDGHVLQVTFAAFVADWTVVRMVLHQTFDNGPPELHCLGIFNGDTCAIGWRGHACHFKPGLLVILIFELLDRALAARANRSQGRMPAEIRKVETQRKASIEQISIWIEVVWPVVDVNSCHAYNDLHRQRRSRM